jgi:hypothetical protein
MIRKKKDVFQFVERFASYSNWDGIKYYFVFQKYKGTVTLMKYQDDTVTYHRMNELICDIKEIIIVDVYEYLWKNRKYINQQLKNLETP